jgi:glucose-6-phosphate 1-dehydrogenase
MSLRRPADQDIVIIGATGDLSRRKLLPALYNLFAVDELLPPSGEIIGVGRGQLTGDDFRSMSLEAVRTFSRTPVDHKAWKAFAGRLAFVSAGPEDYADVARRCEQPSRLVYPAVPPSALPRVVQALAKHQLVQGTRLVVEKPFGRDLASAQELDRMLREVFDEPQILRIDHYLGKETVQNILVFRFGNALFERVWNRDAVDHVQITVAESIGVEGRGAFYEESGALRDIIQNHVLQVLSLLAMEPPSAFHGEAVRDEKAKLMKAVQPVEPNCVVRGQYTAGRIDGANVPGYREEEDVVPDSPTDTFAALELHIDNWRWAGVPFLLRTGKRLPRRATEVKIAFRDAPIQFFDGTEVGELPANHLALSIQPDESITFAFLAKAPGPEVTVKPVHMEFSYGDSFMVKPSEAYERLLHDAMDGDHTLFAREDSVELAWRVLQPVLDAMPPVCFYPAGTWGPREAETLIAPRTWHLD